MGTTARLRGRARLSQGQSVALMFLFAGVYLVVGVAPFIDGDTARLAFEAGRDSAGVDFEPPVTAAVIGAIYALTGAAIMLAEHRLGRLSTWLLVVDAVLFLPLILVISVALSERESTNVVQLSIESLRLGTPIALGALAGLWSERSGVVNIGIEGMMLAGAGVGFTFYAALGEASDQTVLWLAVVVAMVVGGLMAALHALLSVTFRVDQIISGVVVNLLAVGGTSFLRSEVIIPSGNESGRTLPEVSIPLLSDIAIVGDPLFSNQPIFYSMFVVLVATQIVLFRTPWGLRVRASGENPGAAETLGVDVLRIRYQAVILGGFIAGLGGAWFSLEAAGSFANLMTNGAGFIALAALIFGKWRPWPAFAGAMLFGFSRALGARLQILGVEIAGFSLPSQFMQSVPYVVTIIVLAGAIGRAVPPAAVGQPYERSR